VHERRAWRALPLDFLALQTGVQPVEDLRESDMDAVENRREHPSLLIYLFVAYAYR
jgi:hypothetical protein